MINFDDVTYVLENKFAKNLTHRVLEELSDLKDDINQKQLSVQELPKLCVILNHCYDRLQTDNSFANVTAEIIEFLGRPFRQERSFEEFNRKECLVQTMRVLCRFFELEITELTNAVSLTIKCFLEKYG